MKKSEFKKLIKPIVKECIQEALFENGFLSSLIKEVISGVVSAELLTERKKEEFENENWLAPKKNQVSKSNERAKHRLLNAIGSDAYGGVDLFEGTKPLRSAGVPALQGSNPDSVSARNANALTANNIDPNDPGIDIGWFSKIMKKR